MQSEGAKTPRFI